MSIARKFLGIDQPALTLAAEYLVDQSCKGDQVDLRDTVVVVPGARAGRRLLEILVDQAGADSLVLTPPEITTVGQLPELLYQPRKPFADDLVQQLNWTETLRAIDRQTLYEVIPHPPQDSQTMQWLELGKMLQRLHRELASDDLDFEDVWKIAAHLPGFNETRRWQALAKIQQEYLNRLDAIDLWDRQTARLVAIKQKECHTEKRIVLIGTADMNRAMRLMLDQVADHVTALIYAPSEWSKRFDSHGCVVAGGWAEASIAIRDDRILQADDSVDQADRVVRRIAELDQHYRAEEITIGLPDERIVSQVSRQLDACELPNRFGPGRPLSETGPYRLLQAIADYVETTHLREFAALARHPDVERWLRKQKVASNWLIELDEYVNDFYPHHLGDQWRGSADDHKALKAAHRDLDQLLNKHCGLMSVERTSLSTRRMDEWSQPVLHALSVIYGGRTIDLNVAADRATHAACQQIQSQLSSNDRLPAALLPRTTASDAIRLMLSQIAGQSVAAPADEEAIDLVGWLELPLDDAPVLIVTSLNDGFVPKSVNADLFLPDSLRASLNLDDNALRYARDAYALSVILAPWRDTTLITARRDAAGDPLAPSRLLFACDEESVASRALKLFATPKPQPPRPPLQGAFVARRDEFTFEVPRPTPLDKPIDRIYVTAFRSYLACPYRFYLNHILGLQRISDEQLELHGFQFGNLAHDVLQKFAESDEATATEPDRIERCLNHWLNQLATWRYGNHPLAAIQIQMEQLRLRLAAFARWQAQWAAQGWRIEHVEAPARGEFATFDVDGEPIQLRGRIDRIDVNQESGRRILLDYKTSDGGADPEKSHRKRKREWIDLQLPLYRHLAKVLGVDGDVRMGYVLLPKDVDQVGESLAEWTDAELAEADDVARDVIRKIRRQEFWPPTDPPPPYSEEYAAICMDGVFGRKKWE